MRETVIDGQSSTRHDQRSSASVGHRWGAHRETQRIPSGFGAQQTQGLLCGASRRGGEKPRGRNASTHLTLGRPNGGARVAGELTHRWYVGGGTPTRTNPMRGEPAASAVQVQCDGRRSEGAAKSTRDASRCSFGRHGRVARRKSLETRSATRKGHEGCSKRSKSCYCV